ncbi:universal stress protein [Sedimentisphaera salicampi]|uniref:Universal stress protein F n=1 Tax=Sedimentisphaera salicampi TaxID=1941349 RepID=A0A1W6LMW1_9BACT|nr:universal stress protein [Sedimentisphaera salicampi]ARN57086.1 universal stress protein F [Sedimentisphaera salicampi]OXU14925.1 universal stress protein F [Sedimentisphaera salicampi]
MLKTAVIKLDLKEPAEKLLEMAEFMRHFGTKTLHIISTADNHRNRKSINEKTEEAAEKFRSLGYNAQVHIRRGNSATQTLKLAEELKADYIGLYWIPAGVIRRALLGSVDAEILWRARIPVFVYKRRGYLDKKKKLESLLYATDFQETDSKVLPYLCHQQNPAVKLYLLHVGERAPDPYAEQQRRELAKKNLARLAEKCSKAFGSVEQIEVVGWPKRRILFQAWSKDVDLVVLGQSDKSSTFEKILGSTAEAVVHKSRRNALLIP